MCECVCACAQVCVGITYKSSFWQEPHGTLDSRSLFNYLNYPVHIHTHTHTLLCFWSSTGHYFDSHSFSWELTLITSHHYVHRINHIHASPHCNKLSNMLWHKMYCPAPHLHNHYVFMQIRRVKCDSAPLKNPNNLLN